MSEYIVTCRSRADLEDLYNDMETPEVLYTFLTEKLN